MTRQYKVQVLFNCKGCNKPVSRLGKKVNQTTELCGKCNQTGETFRTSREVIQQSAEQGLVKYEEMVSQTVQVETLGQVKVETPLDKVMKEYNKQWKEDKPETQSLEKFLGNNGE